MFDMSSLVKTDWNCQFSIQALAALDWYFNKIKWSNGIYAINKSCTQMYLLYDSLFEDSSK